MKELSELINEQNLKDIEDEIKDSVSNGLGIYVINKSDNSLFFKHAKFIEGSIDVSGKGDINPMKLEYVVVYSNDKDIINGYIVGYTEYGIGQTSGLLQLYFIREAYKREYISGRFFPLVNPKK